MPAIATLPPLYRTSWSIQQSQPGLQYFASPVDCDPELMQGALELLGLRNHFSAMSMFPSPGQCSSTPFVTVGPSNTKKKSKASSSKPSISRSMSVASVIHPSSASKKDASPSSAPTSPLNKGTTKVAATMKPSLRGLRSANKKRKRASRDEVSILKKAFQANPLPPQDVRVRIAQQLGWTPRKVKIWFQNERAKLRKRARDVDDKEGEAADVAMEESEDSGASSQNEESRDGCSSVMSN